MDDDVDNDNNDNDDNLLIGRLWRSHPVLQT